MDNKEQTTPIAPLSAPDPSSNPPSTSQTQNTQATALSPAFAAINPALAGILPQSQFQFANPSAATTPNPGTNIFAATPGSVLQAQLQQQPNYLLSTIQQAAVAAAVPRMRGHRTPTSGSVILRKQCNCKNSRCLKLYCECFASGRYCDGCNCNNCCNNRANEDTRQAAIESILERNPNAFRPKVADDTTTPLVRHNKGCNCKKSGCLKKYCECYQAGVACSEHCKCIDCKNYMGSSARVTAANLAMIAKSRSAAALNGMFVTPGSTVGVDASTAASADATGLVSPPATATTTADGTISSTIASALPGSLGAMNLTHSQAQMLGKVALNEVISPEVIEKFGYLLMVISKEEAERRAQLIAEGIDPVDPGDLQNAHSTSSRRADLYDEQERLILKEFRDTLKTITRVVAEKMEKKAPAVATRQSAAGQQHALSASVQQQPPNIYSQIQPYKGGPIPPGMQPIHTVHNGHHQLVLIPQTVLAQQIAAMPAANQQQLHQQMMIAQQLVIQQQLVAQQQWAAQVQKQQQQGQTSNTPVAATNTAAAAVAGGSGDGGGGGAVGEGMDVDDDSNGGAKE